MKRFLDKKTTGLWVVDVQERLFPKIDRFELILDAMRFTIQAARILKIPIVVSEQYPEGLGHTISSLKEVFPDKQEIYQKTTFSGLHAPVIRKAVLKTDVQDWILVGIESHICILQTAKDLLDAGKGVVVLNDAIGSRSLYEFSTAIGELGAAGARVSSSETVVYELIRDAASPEFKQLLPMIKDHA